ncbi:hypothetical protein FRC02_012051 [Tulasnella sp. 418]|nr:hypothetical protein FRC02_012051 [Tulasnella sp. 418]
MSESPPRLKPRRACDACRRKRTRCDAISEETPCPSCVSKHISCTYIESSKKTGIPKGYVSDLEERMRNLELLAAKVVPDASLLQQLGPTLNLETWLDSHQSKASGPYLSGSNTPFSQRRSPSVYPAPESIVRLRSVPLTPYSDGDAVEEQSPEEESNPVYFLEEAQGRYHGSASSAHLIHTGRAMKKDILGYDLPFKAQSDPICLRPKFWSINSWERDPSIPSDWSLMFHFPPKDLGRSLIELFFDNFIPQYPIVDKTSCLESFFKEKYKSDPSEAALYLLICAVGSKWSSDPRVCVSPELSEGKIDFLSSGWKYFNQICSLPPPSPFRPPKLQDLQVAALGAFYTVSTSVSQVAAHVTGIGIRMAVDVGAHRRSGYGGSCGRPPSEDQWWKRVFWLLTLYDKLNSTVHGWPAAIRDEDFDVDLPLEVDEEYWSTGVPRQPNGKPALVTAFILRLKLGQILGHALGTIYAIHRSKTHFGFTGETWQQNILAELDSKMNQWHDSIPDHLKWNPANPDRVFFAQSATLYLCYHSLQIEIHRPYTPWHRGGRTKSRDATISEASRLICLNAAKQISHALPFVIERKLPDLPEYMKAAAMAGVIITVAALQKIQIARKNGKDAQVDLSAEKEMLPTCMRYLDSAAERWYMAGYASEMLKDIAAPTGILADYTTQSSKVMTQDTRLYSTSHHMPNAPGSVPSYAQQSTSSNPWTLFSSTSSSPNSPHSSIPFSPSSSGVSHLLAPSLDPLIPSSMPKPTLRRQVSAPMFGSDLQPSLSGPGRNVNQTGLHRLHEEEVVRMEASYTSNMSGLQPSVNTYLPFDTSPLFNAGARRNEASLGSNGLATADPNYQFAQSSPPFVGDHTTPFLEEPTYMNMFACLVQAGMGVGVNGMNSESGMNYMRQMFQSLVPFDGVNMGQDIGEGVSSPLGLGVDDFSPYNSQAGASNFDQLSPR